MSRLADVDPRTSLPKRQAGDRLARASLHLLRLCSSLDPAPIGTAPAVVKVSSAPFLILIHRFSTF